MDLEEELCVCFHVPRRKIVKFIRLTRPAVVSRCSECHGAGTGCGWCIPFIEDIYERMAAGEQDPRPRLSGDEYRARRLEYLAKVKMERMRPGEQGPPEATGCVGHELEGKDSTG